MLKKLSLAVAVASATLSGLAYAETVETPVGKLDVTMTATLATDWLNRGRTLNGAPTVQGSFDVAHESGLYVGVWGGSFAGSAGGSEFDYYVGYGSSLTEEFSFDVNLATYTYPKTGWDDDLELSVSVSGYNATLGAKRRFKADTEKQNYIFVGYDVELPAGFGLSLNVGHTDMDDDAAADYVDYGVAISKTIAGVNAQLAYASTDLDKDECNAYSCENNVVFSLSKTF